MNCGSIYDLRTGKETPFSDILGLNPYVTELFINKIAIVQDSITKKWGYLRENDLTYSDIEYCIEGDAYYSALFYNDYAVIELDDKHALIDRNYRIILQDNSQYELLYVLDLDRDLIKIRSKSTGKYGAVNLNGDVIIPCKYDYIYGESEGLIRVEMDGKCGFVNANGRLVIPCIYDCYLSQFVYGTIIIDLKDPFYFKNGYCIVGNNTPPNIVDDTYPSFAVIDKEGNIVLPFNYSYNEWPWDFFVGYCDDIGYYTITKRKDGKKAFISLEDGCLIKGFYWYDDLSYYEDNGFFIFSDNESDGLLNTKGEIVIPLGYYDSIDSFSNGYATVGKEGFDGNIKYGVINSYGNLIIPCIYDTPDIEYYEGIAIVKKDGVLGIIDLYGNSYFFSEL